MYEFKQTSRTHSTCGAHGDDAVFRFAPASFHQNVADLTRTRHAVRMTDRDGTTVHVETRLRQTEDIDAIGRLATKCFVELPKVNVVDAQVVALEQARHGLDRSHAHLVRLHACRGEAHEVAERRKAASLRFLLGHDDECRGAVGELTGIAGSDLETFTFDGR